jgi:hypothetical protein
VPIHVNDANVFGRHARNAANRWESCLCGTVE